MPWKDANTKIGLSHSSPFQVGKSDQDSGQLLEDGVLLPWPSDPLTSWIYYDCAVGVMLDSGIAVHRRLPQIDVTPDTLSSCLLEDPTLDSIGSINNDIGVNLASRDQYTDIVQRMGHSQYWFRLWGQALRVGLKVPIPGIKTIGGVEAIPYDRNPQWAFNRIAPSGNFNGVILWHAAWSLWYTTAKPPRTNTIPAADPSAHIADNDLVVRNVGGIQSPFSQPDDNAVMTSTLTTGGKLGKGPLK